MKIFNPGTKWFQFLFLNMSFSVLIYADDDQDMWKYDRQHRNKTLAGYDKYELPKHPPNTNTTVVFQMIMPKSITIQEDIQAMVVGGYMIFVWNDQRLAYDKKDYNRLDYSHFNIDEIWTPDIYLENSVDTHHNPYSDVHAFADFKGNVVWAPRMNFRARCFLDLTYWPYDTQTCQMVFISWTNHGWALDLQAFNQTSHNTTGHSWKVLDLKITKRVIKYSCCPEPYPDLTYTYVLKRDSPSFAATIVIPALCVALLMFVQFMLPVNHPQRVTVGCVTSVMILLLLIRLSAALPPLATQVPLIVRFYGFALVIVVISVAISGVLIRLSDPQNPIFASPPPAFIKLIFTSPLATVLCMRDKASKIGLGHSGGYDGETIIEEKQSDYTHEWLFIAAAIDRICMILFSAIYILALFIFISPVH